jgi:hypothetical protein
MRKQKGSFKLKNFSVVSSNSGFIAFALMIKEE